MGRSFALKNSDNKNVGAAVKQPQLIPQKQES